jgi:hypothetical protein
MNPANGRFVTQDTYEGALHKPLTLNKYIYAGANPVNNTDPSGNDFTLTETMAAVTINDILLAASPIIGYVAKELIKEAEAGVRLNHYTSWSSLSKIIGFSSNPSGINNPNPDSANYFTPDFYFSGTTAQQKLALQNKPDVCINLTIYPVQDGLEPAYPNAQTVKSISELGLSGGGLEYWTTMPIPFWKRMPVFYPLF